MKLFKRGIACLIALLVVAFSLAGCGSSNNNTGSTTGTTSGNTASTTSSNSGKEVDLIMSTFNNPFFVSVKNGAETEAKKLGYNLVVQNANNDNQTELNLASTDILKKPAALILDPVDSSAIVTAINQANQAGVPVFAFDRLPGGGKILTFVGYDAINAGKNAADALAKSLNNSGKVIEIQGVMGTNVAQDRSKGFEDEMAAKYPNIQIVAKQPADFDRAKALDVMTNLLQANPDVNGVYAANDEMAMGVLSALKAKSLNGKVMLVGNDGIKDALDAITAGDMYASFAESPFNEGVQVADIAGNILKGQTPPPQTTLEGQLVDKTNVAAYWDYLTSIGDPQD